MSLEAVQKVTESEQNADVRKQEALAEAKRIIAQAEQQGAEKLAKAQGEAEQKAAAMLTQAEARAQTQKDAIMKEAGGACDDLRRAAGAKLDAAAALIIRKVVGV